MRLEQGARPSFPRRRERRTQARLGRFHRPAAAAAFATSHEYCARAVRRRARCWSQAAAKEWNVPAAECKVAKGVITHEQRAAARLTARSRRRPPSWSRRRRSRSRIRRTGRSPASREAPRYPTRCGQDGLRIDVRLPGMLYAAIKAVPGVRRQLKSFDAARSRQKGCRGRSSSSSDYAVAVVADSWWQAKTALDALPIVWDEGANAKASSAAIAKARGRAGRGGGVRRQQERRCQAASRGGEEGRGGLRLAVPELRDHGAEERDGA